MQGPTATQGTGQGPQQHTTALPLYMHCSHTCAGPTAPGRYSPNIDALRRAWESSQRSTQEDWSEWMRHFSVELLKESPSPALRATHALAQVGCSPWGLAHDHSCACKLCRVASPSVGISSQGLRFHACPYTHELWQVAC